MAQTVHPVRLPFKLPLNAEKSVDRFVHAYVVLGEQVCIVDTGVAGAEQGIVAALEELGKSLADVAWVVNTHEHPDHIGGNAFFRKASPARFACHEAAVRWIEDLELQRRERPIYGFHQLAGSPVKIDLRLRDGDVIDLGGGVALRVIHTPGHSPGSISLFCTPDRALITADAIQPVGGLPLYSDLALSRASLDRLRDLDGVETLYCAHDEAPTTGEAIPAAVAAAAAYLDRVDAAVAAALKALPPGAAPEQIAAEALPQLGISMPTPLPIVVQSVMAHASARGVAS